MSNPKDGNIKFINLAEDALEALRLLSDALPHGHLKGEVLATIDLIEEEQYEAGKETFSDN